MTYCEEIALRIDKECYKQGISVRSMLRQSGSRMKSLDNIRRGKQGPTAETIIRICRALGKDPNWLLGWEDEHE